MSEIQEKFLAAFPNGRVDEPLKKYSTFQIGGPADYFYRLKELHELPGLLDFVRENSLRFLLIGAGSNMMFHDDGYRGLIIRMEADQIHVNDDQITAEAGAMIPKLIKTSVEAGLTGLEPWMGLPGTVGGAVRGNAGCNGLETSDILVSARLFNPEAGDISDHEATFFEFTYRHSALKEHPQAVLQATFQLKKLDTSPEEQQKQLDHYRMLRITKQPFGATTGSFFKNPAPDKPAGMLIDEAGLKGHKLGNAQISDKHANFFLNTGGATCQEMLDLVHLAQKTVKDKFDIDLEPEVQIVLPE